jgi:hypothetical protein
MEEGLDYYINQKGQYVFTEVYLKKRGHCCLLHCLHCPYGHNTNANANSETEKSPDSIKNNQKK